MPPPQLPAQRPAPPRDRVESRVDHRNELSRDLSRDRPSTSSTTHNSIEPEYNRTPQLPRDHPRDPTSYNRDARDTFEPVPGPSNQRGPFNPRNDLRPDSRSFSPDLQPGPINRGHHHVDHHQSRDHHQPRGGGMAATNDGHHVSSRDHYHMTNPQHRSQSPYQSVQEHNGRPGPSASTRFQSPNRNPPTQVTYHRTMNHHPQAREQQVIPNSKKGSFNQMNK